METPFSKRNIIIALIVVLCGLGLWVLIGLIQKPTSLPEPVLKLDNSQPVHRLIGRSVEGKNIEAYTYGQGEKQLLFVGGIHGGYEWNTVLVAYQLMDYLKDNPDVIPANLKITVIPVLNPDGLNKVVGTTTRFVATDALAKKLPVGTGRLNAHQVDLNRNFDCKWQPKSTWRETVVSAGAKVFSEPEAVAFRDFVLQQKPSGVIFWHSQANAIYTSECHAGVLPATLELAKTYSLASGYQIPKLFDSYEVTGDADSWLASIGIPAISVELKTHEDVEWEKNLSGIKALLK